MRWCYLIFKCLQNQKKDPLVLVREKTQPSPWWHIPTRQELTVLLHPPAAWNMHHAGGGLVWAAYETTWGHAVSWTAGTKLDCYSFWHFSSAHCTTKGEKRCLPKPPTGLRGKMVLHRLLFPHADVALPNISQTLKQAHTLELFRF